MVGGPFHCHARCLLFALAALFFLGTAAQAAEPTQEELQATYDQLFQETLRRPNDLDLLFAFAGVAIKLGDYESAISTLERMLLLNPDLPRVKLELGALYYRLGSYAAARRYFEEAQASPNVPPDVNAKVDAYLQRIDEQTADNLWAGFLMVGGQYQTNANAGPVSEIVRAGGIDAVLDDEFQAEGDFSVYGLGVARNTQRFALGDALSGLSVDSDAVWQSNVQSYYSRQIKFTDLNVGLLALDTGPQLEIVTGDKAGDSVYLRPYLLGDFAALGDKPFYYTFGAGLTLAGELAPEVILRGTYEYRYRTFHNSDEFADVGEMTGGENDIGFELSAPLVDAWRVRLGAVGSFDQAREDYQANQELTVYGAVETWYAGPFGWSNEPWQASLAVVGVMTDYEAPDPSVDPEVSRADKEYRINFSNTVPIVDDWALVGQVEWQDNNSNLPNYSFNNLTVSLAITWDF